MVKVYIIPKSKSQTDEIVAFLLQSKYLLTTMLIENVELANLDDNNQTQRRKRNIVTGIIRSLQFNALNEGLRKKYKDHMPLLYSVPITHMDPEQADMIIQYSNNW